MTDDSRAPGGPPPDGGRGREPEDVTSRPSLLDKLLVSGPPRHEGMAPPDPGGPSPYGGPPPGGAADQPAPAAGPAPSGPPGPRRPVFTPHHQQPRPAPRPYG